MSVALLIGCGGDRAEHIVKACHLKFDKVINVGASAIDVKQFPKAVNHQVDWKALDLNTINNICKDMDQVNFIFFNQNRSSLSPINFSDAMPHFEILQLVKSWTDAHWTSCQLPFFVVKALESKMGSDIKIGWMLSSYIDHKHEDVEKHPDYSGNKFTNYLIMKSFSKKYPCFGIYPDFSKDTLFEIMSDICNEKISCEGQVIDVFTIDENK